MTIEDKFPQHYKGFLIRKKKNTLILSDDKYEKSSIFFKKEELENIEINPVYFSPKDLDFLNYFDKVKGLFVLTNNLNNVDSIYSLPFLETLKLDHRLKVNVDFSKIKGLRNCMLEWGTKGSDTIFDALSLERLRINKYNEYEIIPIAGLRNLRKLEIVNNLLVNLSGLNNLKNLTYLNLFGSKRLDNLRQIDELICLESLVLDHCKNIENLSQLVNMSELKMLHLNNMGKIHSLSFIKNLKNLEDLMFVETQIVDGDLNYAYELFKEYKLKKIGFLNRRKYTHSLEDFGFTTKW